MKQTTKRLLKFLMVPVIFYLLFTLTPSIPAQGQTAGPNSTSMTNPEPDQQGKTIDIREYDSPEMEDEDLFSYDQDLLTRKLFQKKLPPLTKKEKIIWSFRLAETNAFL